MATSCSSQHFAAGDRVSYKQSGTPVTTPRKPGKVLDKRSRTSAHGFVITEYLVLLDNGTVVESSTWWELRSE